MSTAATSIGSFRAPDIVSYWTVPIYADLSYNVTQGNIKVGDFVTVLSTGVRYRVLAPENFEPVSGLDGGLSQAVVSEPFYGVSTNFKDGVGKAVADTATSFKLPSGILVHGDGVDQTDSGIVTAFANAVPIATLTASATSGKTAALSYGSATEPWDPATFGPMVIEGVVAINSALTARSFFLGFVGANNVTTLTAPASGSTVTITNNQADMAGLYFDSGLTAGTTWMVPSNKANASPTQTVASATTSVAVSAAGTYAHLKVMITAGGGVKAWVDGVLVANYAAGTVATATPLAPVLCITSLASATKAALIKSVSMYSLA